MKVVWGVLPSSGVVWGNAAELRSGLGKQIPSSVVVWGRGGRLPVVGCWLPVAGLAFDRVL